MKRNKKMTDAEIMWHIENRTRLDRAREVLSAAVGRLEQAEAQRRKPTPIERRRMEFEEVRKIADELNVSIYI